MQGRVRGLFRILLVALPSLLGPAAASANAAFKTLYILLYDPASASNNWVSIPYSFEDTTSIDLCARFNGGPRPLASNVKRVVRWNAGSDTPAVTRCDSTFGSGFPVVPGEAYSIVPSNPSVLVTLVGAHDDRYSANLGGTSRVPLQFTPGLSNYNWVSVPNHTLADTAVDLCQELNGGPTVTRVSEVVSYDTRGGIFDTQSCASPDNRFFLTPGSGYALVPVGPAVSVQFDAYGCGGDVGNLVEARASGGDVVLDFPGAPGTWWEIYRDTMKFSLCSSLLAVVNVPTFTDLDVGSILPDIYYGVRVCSFCLAMGGSR